LFAPGDRPPHATDVVPAAATVERHFAYDIARKRI
jgi:hypothetical protein